MTLGGTASGQGGGGVRVGSDQLEDRGLLNHGSRSGGGSWS